MSRIDEVKESTRQLQRSIGLNSEEKRQAFTIGILADISDSIALLCDMYAHVHSIEFETHKVGNNHAAEK